MKKKLALFLSVILLTSSLPTATFAATTNEVDRILSVRDGADLSTATTPILSIYDKNLVGFGAEAQEDLSFKLSLQNAEWSSSFSKDSVTISNGTGGEVITVDSLTGSMAIVSITGLMASSTTADIIIKIKLDTEAMGSGDATVTIDPMSSVISAGTYKFATVYGSGSTTTTTGGNTNIAETGTVISPIIISEEVAGTLKGDVDGYFKLKLTNGFSFKSDNKQATNVTGLGDVYAISGVVVTATPNVGTPKVYISKDGNEAYVKFSGSGFGVDGYKTSNAVTISISGLMVGYDSSEVSAGDTASITITGYGYSNAETDSENENSNDDNQSNGNNMTEEVFSTKVQVTIGSKIMIVDGKNVELDQVAYISQGYTMMPISGVVSALEENAKVSWSGETQQVIIESGSRTITMTVGSKIMDINGEKREMAKALEITGDRAFIPLRDLSYGLGLGDDKISWNSATKTVTLN